MVGLDVEMLWGALMAEEIVCLRRSGARSSKANSNWVTDIAVGLTEAEVNTDTFLEPLTCLVVNGLVRCMSEILQE